ncbi:MAG: hypothetical protein L0Z50_27480 [Verrucomicrobiales bacterium]|nr:hypothetical protein [Verrucomicrobiales bacterium]
MFLLTEDALLVCKHELGKVDIQPTQSLVTIAGRRVLVELNPESRSIIGCPMYGPMIRPCQTTLPVKQGYSALLRISGQRVCLDTVTGLTDGSPPGAVDYLVRAPGQQLVKEGA